MPIGYQLQDGLREKRHSHLESTQVRPIEDE